MDKKVRHTPGPWVERENRTVVGDAQQLVAIVYGETLSAQAANCRLITAAPQLLEALEAVIRLKDLLVYPREVSEAHIGEAYAVDGMISKVEQAIKLAKDGES